MGAHASGAEELSMRTGQGSAPGIRPAGIAAGDRTAVPARAVQVAPPDTAGYLGDARPSLWQERRMGWELLELLASPIYYGVGVPRGDGAPVLLVPGFLGSDDYLTVLHGWLRRVGYRPHLSGIDACLGSLTALTERLERRVAAVTASAGRPVTLVGHSLGGILSGLVARRRPAFVDHVVTLGSPHRPLPPEGGDPKVHALAAWLLWDRAAAERAYYAAPLPDDVRLSSIYSREDAIVDWRTSLVAGPAAAAYRVGGTHVGLAWNVAVYRLLSRLLLADPLDTRP
jgi:triacylglycerol lipase